MKTQETTTQPPDFENQWIQSFKKHPNKSLKTLMSLYKGNYLNLFGSTCFYILKHSPVWVLPIVTANIIDAATYPSDRSISIITRNVAIMILLLLQNIPSNYIHTKLYSKSIRFVEAGLRSSLVRKLQQLSIRYHNEMQSGRLQSKIMRDVEAIETLSSQLFISLLNILLNIIVALTITISKSLLVFGFFMMTIPVAVGIIVIFRKKVKVRNNEFRKEIEETSAKVMEMVELIPVTKAHGLEQYEIDRIEGQLVKVAERGYHLDMIQSFFGSISWVAFQVFQVICLAFTGYLAYKSTISVGDVVLYQSYFASVINQVSAVIGLLPIIAKGFESIHSVGDVLLVGDVEDYEGKHIIDDVKGNVSFQQVKFHYEDTEKPVLDGFDLHVKEGETIALVGGSGAGKTTVLNLVIGFFKPSKGTLTIDGIDIGDLNYHEFRKHIAVVPQTSILFTGTIRDNITYGLPNVSEEALKKVIEAANLSELIESLPDGLDTLITEHGSNLSGGQRQRISIARALIREPKIIVLDEATSALDSISEKKIQSALNRLMQGRTTFVVAHRLSTIKDADRIVVVNGGKNVECGTYDELMERKGAFYQLKKVQS